MIRINLKRAMFNIPFIITIFAIGILELLDSVGNYSEGRTTFEIFLISGLTMFSITTYAVSTLPYSRAYCEDAESGMMTNILNRSSSIKYTIALMIACGIASFIAVFCGEIVCILIYNIKCDFIDDITIATNSGYGGAPSLMNSGHYNIYILCEILLRAFRGSFFGMFALTMSAFIKNKFVIISTPVLLFYMLMRVGYGIFNLPIYLNIRGVYFCFVFGNEKEILSVLYTFAFTLCCGVICGLIMEHKVRRCI